MDRFIDTNKSNSPCRLCNLKSNMDRFIAYLQVQDKNIHNYLKSNMDRFIAVG